MLKGRGVNVISSLLLTLTILLTGCSTVPYVISAADFALNLWDRNNYYSQECLWYEPVQFEENTKTWIKQNNPDASQIRDLEQIARNNDLFREACK